MKPELLKTNDGSLTLRLNAMDETYHSTNGALTETQHVYIQNGLLKSDKTSIRILEVGFGTGLNALVTLDAFRKQNKIKSIHYTSLEKHPVDSEIYDQLNYGHLLSPNLQSEFLQMHQVPWEEDTEISPNFTLHKKEFDLLEDTLEGEFDMIFYDAFAPSKQCLMWNDETLEKVCHTLKPGGLFSTYCAKGDVRRSLKRCGLKMKRLPGPPGKWEMLFGTKI